jgi:uncharacterized membrane protein
VNDDRMDQIIGKLLRVGVVLAAAVVAAGGIWYLAGSGEMRPGYGRFRPDVRSLHALSTLPRPQAVILIGLLILIATPIARVVFSLVAFWMERDKVYMAITLTVLAILLYSLGTSWL